MFSRISELLDEQGKSQKDLATAVGVSTGNVSDWKSGRAKPNSDVLVRIAEYLDVTVDYLLGVSNIRSTKALTEMYKVGIDKWLIDQAFTEEESKALSGHYLDMLFRYKDAINALSNNVHSERRKELISNDASGETVTIESANYIRREVRSLIDWMVALPFYFNSNSQFSDKDTSELFEKLYAMYGVLREGEIGRSELDEDESDLLGLYRSLDKSGRRVVMGTIESECRRMTGENG